MGFASPGQRLLRAHIDPDILPRWLGTPDLSLSVGHVDPRPGGRFDIEARFPEGPRSVASGQFVDLAETRIRLEARLDTGIFAGIAPRPVQITLEIEAEAHGTRLTLSLRFADRTTRDAALNGSLAATLDRAYSRLDALLQD
ncbi:SRPBCC domain-containing protein [Paragemmobacter aquarius]|nr:SRPBCC domain-containing protein [Gemmobacter aquarius]